MEATRADFCPKCIYTLGGGDFLLLNEYCELADRGIMPEQEILTRHFCYLGPVPKAIFDIIDDDDWCAALKEATTVADEIVKDELALRLERLSEELGSQATCHSRSRCQPSGNASCGEQGRPGSIGMCMPQSNPCSNPDRITSRSGCE